jgi:hypothetical protein
LLRVEVTYTPEGVGKGRCKVSIMQRVPDGADGQTRWERLGNLGMSKSIWEQVQAIILLGSSEAGIEVEFSEDRMEVEAESDWARARREAQEGAVKMARKIGVEL